MPDRAIKPFLYVGLLISNLAVLCLCILVFYYLRVTPSDVRLEQEFGFKALSLQMADVGGKIENNRRELEDRLPRIMAIEEKIDLQTRDRLLRSEMEEWMVLAQDWVKQARKKGIDLPDLPPIPDFPKVTQ